MPGMPLGVKQIGDVDVQSAQKSFHRDFQDFSLVTCT